MATNQQLVEQSLELLHTFEAPEGSPEVVFFASKFTADTPGPNGEKTKIAVHVEGDERSMEAIFETAIKNNAEIVRPILSALVKVILDNKRERREGLNRKDKKAMTRFVKLSRSYVHSRTCPVCATDGDLSEVNTDNMPEEKRKVFELIKNLKKAAAEAGIGVGIGRIRDGHVEVREMPDEDSGNLMSFILRQMAEAEDIRSEHVTENQPAQPGE